VTDFSCTVIEDSLHPWAESRLTTLELLLPRPFLVDFNTYRQFSRNSESSRAKPPERRLEELDRGGMYVPTFGSRTTGMGQGVLVPQVQAEAQDIWRWMADMTATGVQMLIDLGVDKSHANRPLEAYVWQRIVATSDAWENFIAQRTQGGAAPEMETIAHMVDDALLRSDPRQLSAGEWHLPYVTTTERCLNRADVNLLLSARRCARISFDSVRKPEDQFQAITKANILKADGHMSPFEHQATAQRRVRDLLRRHKLRGNFTGPWVQHRKLLPYEANFADHLRSQEA
jgi:hypothetical protein